jgi:hypothetical protein
MKKPSLLLSSVHQGSVHEPPVRQAPMYLAGHEWLLFNTKVTKRPNAANDARLKPMVLDPVVQTSRQTTMFRLASRKPPAQQSPSFTQQALDLCSAKRSLEEFMGRSLPHSPNGDENVQPEHICRDPHVYNELRRISKIKYRRDAVAAMQVLKEGIRGTSSWAELDAAQEAARAGNRKSFRAAAEKFGQATATKLSTMMGRVERAADISIAGLLRKAHQAGLQPAYSRR